MTAYFLELKNFSERAGAEVRSRMTHLSNLDACLIEWTPALREVCKFPDLTIIAPLGLTWRALAMITKFSSGRYIVLHDSVEPALGLAVLPLNFSLHDLFTHMPERRSIVYTQSARRPAVVKPEHEFKTTMPMPVPADCTH